MIKTYPKLPSNTSTRVLGIQRENNRVVNVCIWDMEGSGPSKGINLSLASAQELRDQLNHALGIVPQEAVVTPQSTGQSAFT